jgi:CHAD domain-containing protein
MAKARPVDVTADMPFREAARATLAVRAPEMLSYREGTLRGDDIEELHSLRVSTRRLRAVLEVYGECFPAKQHRAVLGLVKETADALSGARDLDVQIDFLERFMGALEPEDQAGIRDLVAWLRTERRRADGEIAPALRRLDDEGFLARVSKLVGRELETA